MNKLELTDEEVRIFNNIQKWYQLLHILEKHKVYGMQSSTITIQFDSQGVISKIEKVEHLRP